MSNLGLENLNPTLQIQSAGAESISSAGEARVSNVMRQEGMATPADGGAQGGGKTFSEMLRGSIDQVNDYQHQADRAIKELVAGRTKNIHETMLAIERADNSLKLMVQVRNKILDAYREIMRMQV